MRLALERNLDIRVERLTPPLFDYSLAGLQSTYEPLLTSQVATQSTVTPSTSTIAGAAAASAITQRLTTFNAGLTQNLRWGGGGLTVLANMLRGFRTDGTRNQIEVTRLNQQVAQLDLEATITNTVSDVRNAYRDLVYATESVDVARQSLQIAQQLVSDNQHASTSARWRRWSSYPLSRRPRRSAARAPASCCRRSTSSGATDSWALAAPSTCAAAPASAATSSAPFPVATAMRSGRSSA